jgi:hypothetical protein
MNMDMRAGFDKVKETRERWPEVHDSGREEIGYPGVAAEGLEDGEDAGDFVRSEQVGKVGEGGDKDYGGEGLVAFGAGFGVD